MCFFVVIHEFWEKRVSPVEIPVKTKFLNYDWLTTCFHQFFYQFSSLKLNVTVLFTLTVHKNKQSNSGSRKKNRKFVVSNFVKLSDEFIRNLGADLRPWHSGKELTLIPTVSFSFLLEATFYYCMKTWKTVYYIYGGRRLTNTV